MMHKSNPNGYDIALSSIEKSGALGEDVLFSNKEKLTKATEDVLANIQASVSLVVTDLNLEDIVKLELF